jgi:hypothetical protein
MYLLSDGHCGVFEALCALTGIFLHTKSNPIESKYSKPCTIQSRCKQNIMMRIPKVVAQVCSIPDLQRRRTVGHVVIQLVSG